MQFEEKRSLIFYSCWIFFAIAPISNFILLCINNASPGMANFELVFIFFPALLGWELIFNLIMLVISKKQTQKPRRKYLIWVSVIAVLVPILYYFITTWWSNIEFNRKYPISPEESWKEMEQLEAIKGNK